MALAFLVTVFALIVLMGLRELNRNGVIAYERSERERVERSRRLCVDSLERESQRCIRAEAMVAEMQERIRMMRDVFGC